MSLGTLLVALLVVVVVGALGWLILRKPAPQPAPRSAAVGAGKAKDPIAVQIAISSSERACAKVKELVGKRYSAIEKPALPLAGCPYPQQCECRYKKVLDERDAERRSGKDRRLAGQRFEQDKKPRRSGKDRRKKNLSIDWDRH